MARKTTSEKTKPKKRMQRRQNSPGDGFNASAQDSEYLNLRKRVDARKDAKQILEIAQRIEDESDR